MMRLWSELRAEALTEAEQKYFAQFPYGTSVVIKRGNAWERGISRGLLFPGKLQVRIKSGEEVVIGSPEEVLQDPAEIL